jgi:hypothetical protein
VQAVEQLSELLLANGMGTNELAQILMGLVKSSPDPQRAILEVMHMVRIDGHGRRLCR